MIQTYEPSSPGMIICISGGEYVKTTDHLAAMEEKDAEIRKKDNLICEQGMQIEETYKVLEGEVVCDFAMSFGLVDRAAGLKESLRLSELRGESLDRVVAEGVQKELKLENEIAALNADGIMINKQRDALEAKLSRLTAALNDDERAEKLKGDAILHWNRSYILGRTEGINDYRAMLLGEVEG